MPRPATGPVTATSPRSLLDSTATTNDFGTINSALHRRSAKRSRDEWVELSRDPWPESVAGPSGPLERRPFDPQRARNPEVLLHGDSRWTASTDRSDATSPSLPARRSDDPLILGGRVARVFSLDPAAPPSSAPLSEEYRPFFKATTLRFAM
ncbi:hypothetical protein KM043_000377 [Ampulex compressa]|nr:hypothetical protein KM043_000377 [Ampulex compressa]